MLFVQTTAPTGWTKSTAHDNKALRVVSGTASSGGSVAFTTAFASQAVNGTNASVTATNQNTTAGGSVSTSLSVGGSVSATTLVESQMPSHSHAQTGRNATTKNSNPTFSYTEIRSWGSVTGLSTTNSSPTAATGGNGSHTHGFTNPTYTSAFTGTAHTHTQDAHTHTFTGTAINLAVQYVDVIVATKD